MGYPTDVKFKEAVSAKGINGVWDSSGNALGSGEGNQVTVLDTNTGKGGVFIHARLLSKHKDVKIYVLIDDGGILGNSKETPAWLMSAYGCCGQWGPTALVTYDTVNDKYILEVFGPIPFGDRLRVILRQDTGSAQNCCGEVQYVVNN